METERQEKFDQISDQDVFNEAVEPEPKLEESKEASPEEPKDETQEDRPRDEKGRFAAKEEEKLPEPAIQPQPQPEPVEQSKEEKQDHRVPLTELLNERERRQEAQRQREALEQQLAAMQRQLEELKTPKGPPPDMFADPDAWQTYQRQAIDERFAQIDQAIKSAVGNMSLQRAADKHGALFQEAYEAVLSRPPDDSVRQRVVASPDPGETLVTLYRQEKFGKEVGYDPEAYKAKVLEEALKDQQFLSKAVEAVKAAAGVQPKQLKIDIPPSLNKVTAAASATDTDSLSDSGLYTYATR